MHGGHSTAKIRYKYTVGGTEYENDKIEFGLYRGIMTWGHADRLINRFPDGRQVEIYYDPSRPSLSSLVCGGIGWEDVFMFPICAAGIIYGMKNLRIFIKWLAGRILHPSHGW